MIQITSDWDDVERELERLSRMPTAEMNARLGGVLEGGYALTQAAVHRETGALAASGKKKTSHIKTTHEWGGEISYGDESVVDYAIYEKRRGVHWVGKTAARGDHDFMRPLEAIQPLFTEAIREGLS